MPNDLDTMTPYEVGPPKRGYKHVFTSMNGLMHHNVADAIKTDIMTALKIFDVCDDPDEIIDAFQPTATSPNYVLWAVQYLAALPEILRLEGLIEGGANV